MQHKIRMLGLDPGIKNFGIAVCELNKNSGKTKVLETGLLKSPINSFVDGIKGKVASFDAEIERWVREYNPNGFIAERFQSRGLKGTSIELVSFMLGYLSCKYSNLPYLFVTAATWKNDINRILAPNDYDLKKLYKKIKGTPHQLDAALMAIYGLKKSTGLDNSVKYRWKKLVNSINKVY